MTAQLCTGLREALAVFTLGDEQIIWMNKSSQTNKSSDACANRTNRLFDEQIV